MDFARKILENYGWKEGDGLGKNKNGIAKPLKASLKFDNAGFGADQAADDFNNHWWERVFNEAATNVSVSQEGERVRMALKDKDSSVEISTKGYSIKKLKKLKKVSGESCSKSSYDNFLRAATLTNQGSEIENADKIDVNDIEVSKVNVLTDEELFKACGGRTAHKGARHGLKLSGKLSRIEQQEEELLAKMMAKRSSLIENDKHSKNELAITSANVPEECTYQNKEECAKEHKVKKKKRKHSEKNANEIEENLEMAFVKRKKKEVSKEAGVVKICDDNVGSTSSFSEKGNSEKEHVSKNNSLEEKSVRKKKNKKKRKE